MANKYNLLPYEALEIACEAASDIMFAGNGTDYSKEIEKALNSLGFEIREIYNPEDHIHLDDDLEELTPGIYTTVREDSESW